MSAEDPRHGTVAGYQAHRKAGSRACGPCENARYRYAKGLMLDHNRGIRRRISAAKAREHVVILRMAGMSPRDIARAAGISPTTVQNIIGTDAVIVRETEAALLRIRPPAKPSRTGYVPRAGVVLRLRALSALGWSNSELARRLDQHRSRIANLVNDQPARETAWVQASTWHAVDELFAELCMTPGPSIKVRERAKRRGWKPPLAFDALDPASLCPPIRARSCGDGSDGGYYRHVRTLKEPACEACLTAHRQYERDRKRRQRAGDRDAA